MAEVEKNRKNARELLATGGLLYKYDGRRKSRQNVWCHPSMDRILWSEGKKTNIQGFVFLDDVTDLKDAFSVTPGSPRQPRVGCQITIVHAQGHHFQGNDSNIVELETDTPEQRQQWLNALRIVCRKSS